MEKETRSAIETATQKARRLLEADFQEQLDGVFDVRSDGRVAEEPGAHLDAAQRRVRRKIVATIEHKRAGGMKPAEAVADYLRDAAFTVLNRFVALKMLEARELVQPCVSQGEASSGFNEFCGLAPGVRTADGAGYRLYLECLFDELSTEVKVLFDRRDAPSAMWPRRAAFLELLDLLNAPALAGVWAEDETIGWVYQYFNGQDERRAMRDASQAPRNGRELAVRNQFFTPRYVVQFLTDNTLGRIWYEMRDGETALTDQCEYMVRQLGETWAPRAKKDPRDLRVLDPACGSGHFLLYAFDLLVTIYQEAWADPSSPASEVTGATLRADYPDMDALRLAMPGLILAHNLYGVDIDARCAQIAQLALWMRAQRAFREFGVARAARPLIRRSNIVIAEPMPGEQDLRDEFLRELKEDRLEGLMRRALDIPADRHVHTNKAMADSLAALVETVWDDMTLAGDMGVLLKIERTLARGIEQARAQWAGDLPLFPISTFGLAEERAQIETAEMLRSYTGEGLDFWGKAERLVFRALEEYADAAPSAGFARRRLFADDAAHGFALVDLVSNKFDVVLMNPPFGAPTETSKITLDGAFPASKQDLYAVFVDRGIDMLEEFGVLGAITSRNGFFQPSNQKWREAVLLGVASPTVVADLGFGVLDSAMVETAAYVVQKGWRGRSVWFRLVGEDDKPEALKRQRHRFDVPDSSVFKEIPLSPFTYWLPQSVQKLFSHSLKFESKTRNVRCGMGTLDDFRFVRNWWEVRNAATWTPYAKGGELSAYVADMPAVVNFREAGREVKAFVEQRVGSASRKIQAESYYYRAGLQYGRRIRNPSPAILPPGAIFSDNANGIFIAGDDRSELLATLALLNSNVAKAILTSIAPVRKMEVGYLQKLPVPLVSRRDIDLIEAAKVGIAASMAPLRSRETSRFFYGPLNYRAPELISIESNASAAFGIPREDVQFLKDHSQVLKGDLIANSDEDDDELVEPSENTAFTAQLPWHIGVAFGRFDIRTAIGERTDAVGPDPFDPLPAKSPGMLPDGDAPFMPTSGVFVDDPGSADDLTARVTAVYERVGEASPAPDALRRSLAKDFFPDHIRMYSKSRRKAPIYWQLATPSASYSVWLYIHAFGKDTVFRVQNDYVAPKLSHERRELEGLLAEAGPSPTTAQSRLIEAQTAFVEELSALLDEVKRVAPLWNPDLDDGVILNFAPLWRLVPQNRAWQKELRAAWASLVAGDYDWAHLSMRLWPDRVVPKCAKDRSLAIAHDLENVFWFEDAAGKWQARPTATRSVDDLIAERTSPAIKAALQSLLEAPDPVAPSGRGRRKKS